MKKAIYKLILLLVVVWWFGSSSAAQAKSIVAVSPSQTPLVKTRAGHTVYAVVDGHKIPISSPAELKSLGYSWKNLRTISEKKMKSLPMGSVDARLEKNIANKNIANKNENKNTSNNQTTQAATPVSQQTLNHVTTNDSQATQKQAVEPVAVKKETKLTSPKNFLMSSESVAQVAPGYKIKTVAGIDDYGRVIGTLCAGGSDDDDCFKKARVFIWDNGELIFLSEEGYNYNIFANKKGEAVYINRSNLDDQKINIMLWKNGKLVTLAEYKNISNVQIFGIYDDGKILFWLDYGGSYGGDESGHPDNGNYFLVPQISKNTYKQIRASENDLAEFYSSKQAGTVMATYVNIKFQLNDGLKAGTRFNDGGNYNLRNPVIEKRGEGSPLRYHPVIVKDDIIFDLNDLLPPSLKDVELFELIGFNNQRQALCAGTRPGDETFSYFVVQVPENLPPHILFFNPSPLENGRTDDNTYIIKWNNSDPEDDTTVSLYYTFDRSESGGELIAKDIKIPKGKHKMEYKWDISIFPNNSMGDIVGFPIPVGISSSVIKEKNANIYAVINDGINVSKTYHAISETEFNFPFHVNNINDINNRAIFTDEYP